MRKMKLKILWSFFMFGNFLKRIFMIFRSNFGCCTLRSLHRTKAAASEMFWAFLRCECREYDIFFMFYKFTHTQIAPTTSTDVLKNLKFSNFPSWFSGSRFSVIAFAAAASVECTNSWRREVEKFKEMLNNPTERGFGSQHSPSMPLR